jgi:hypothetical protein
MKAVCIVRDIRHHLTENTLPVHCDDRTKRTDGPNAVLRHTKAGGVCQWLLDCLQLCALLRDGAVTAGCYYRFQMH